MAMDINELLATMVSIAGDVFADYEAKGRVNAKHAADLAYMFLALHDDLSKGGERPRAWGGARQISVEDFSDTFVGRMQDAHDRSSGREKNPPYKPTKDQQARLEAAVHEAFAKSRPGGGKQAAIAPRGSTFPWHKYVKQRHPYGGYNFLPKVQRGQWEEALSLKDVIDAGGTLEDILTFEEANRDWFKRTKRVFVQDRNKLHFFKNIYEAVKWFPNLFTEFVGPTYHNAKGEDLYDDEPRLNDELMRFDDPETFDRLSR